MKDYNASDWDWTKLQGGLAILREQFLEWREVNPKIAEDLRHTVDFIEMNIREGEILSPLQTYMTEK